MKFGGGGEEEPIKYVFFYENFDSSGLWWIVIGACIFWNSWMKEFTSKNDVTLTDTFLTLS